MSAALGSSRPTSAAPSTQWNDASSLPQLLAFIRLPGHHPDALIPEVGARVSAADAVGVDMRQLALDSIRGSKGDTRCGRLILSCPRGWNRGCCRTQIAKNSFISHRLHGRIGMSAEVDLVRLRGVA